MGELLELAFCLDMSPTSLLTFASELTGLTVGTRPVDPPTFADWLFESRALPGQDAEEFRRLAPVNLLKVGDLWSFVGDHDLDFELAVSLLEGGVVQRI